MAHSDPPPPEVLETIAQKIAAAIDVGADNRFLAASATPIELTETFEVWGLKPGAIDHFMRTKEVPADLNEWAQSIGRWHHQIKLGEARNAYARSKLSDANPVDPVLCKLHVSPIAANIESAVRWADNDLQNDPLIRRLGIEYDPLVRLFEVPAYRLTAFLLVNEADQSIHIYIIKALPGNGKLEPGMLLTPREFFEALTRQPPPGGIA